MNASIQSSIGAESLAKEQGELLDLIDKLQFAQLDNVKLPQIVVVGDQSAGKSSVLEALTGTPFPRDAGACTRFATEIRLRRAKQPSLKVSIIPDKSRPADEQARLLHYGGNVSGDYSFESMMRDATELIAPKNLPGRFAARDILVVEKSGPDMPLLTLVDLPGLVRVANRDQSDADIQTIEALSDRYMKSSRTIILAVVGGNNDYVQAPILKKARHFDPDGSRTIGVLTKPDMTERIGLEEKFIELITNQDQENHFKLGWYVLLNPGPGERWQSPQERLEMETNFFTRGRWGALPPHMWGVGALQEKLSSQLQRHIGKHVKSLRRQIQQALERCDAQLKDMGKGRDTVEEMQLDMSELFTTSNNLITPAVHGHYKNPFGERFFSRQSHPKGTPSQKLRARVRDESDRFAARFRQRGRRVHFDSTSTSGGQGTPGTQSMAKRDFAQQHVEPLLRQIRGNELPLDSNPRAPYILFQDYSTNWPSLAQEFKDNLAAICNEFLADLVGHVWPQRMRQPFQYHFLAPKMREISEGADKELSKLIDDMELEIQPFDPEYEERLRAWRVQATLDGATYTEAEEVLEKMLIYYDLTARVFVRNVITQVVERHLLLGMLGLFNPSEILRMDAATVESIAAESKEVRERRKALKAQRIAIEEARNICASLAMRSELRSAQDEIDDDVATDEEASSFSLPRRSTPYASNLTHQSSTRSVSSRRQVPESESSRYRTDEDVRQPTSPAATSQAQANSNNNPYHRGAPPSSWEQNQQYVTTSGNQEPPRHVPPPPPRPQKVGFEDAERYYDATTPRTESYGSSSGGRNRESMRQKLAQAIRPGI